MATFEMTREDAEEYTQALGQVVAGGWRQIALGKRLGVPEALGLSVQAWVEQRLGGYVKLSVEERKQAAQELMTEGMSQRQVAQVLGVSPMTINSDLRPVQNRTPEPVIQAQTDEQTVQNYTPDSSPLDVMTGLAANEALRRRAEQEVKREQLREEVKHLPAPAPMPTDKANAIVIDPPWPMEKILRDVAPNQVGFDYPTMTLDEIRAFGAQLNPSSNCHLFMWTTQKFLPAAFEILETWGFRYIFTMVWHKPGGFQPFNLPQYNCEFVLYGRMGSPEFLDLKDFPTCFNAPRREHSRKPDEFYNMVRRVCAEPRIDVFSREERDGFKQFGNEENKFS